MKKNKGFTLIEMLIVISILGVIAAMVVPKVMSRPDQARVVAAKADVQSIMSALKLYKLDNGAYPTTDQGLAALVSVPTAAPIPRNWNPDGYLEKVPSDPWGRDYVYRYDAATRQVQVMSYGADGEPGGQGFDADISNQSSSQG